MVAVSRGRSTLTLEGNRKVVARFYAVVLLRRSLWALTLCIASSGVLGDTKSEGCPESGVRIYVDASGVVTVNGRAVPASRLPQTLASLMPQPTEVCYSRANAQSEPPPNAMAVMEAVASLRLPVAFYTDGTFTRRVKLN